MDEKDTVFIAMTEFLKCVFWSGDLELIKGLRQKGYDKILNTHELLEILA